MSNKEVKDKSQAMPKEKQHSQFDRKEHFHQWKMSKSTSIRHKICVEFSTFRNMTYFTRLPLNDGPIE